ncbi:MAG: hypothetical protein FJX22_02365 [Alphaproteobacteria bacterium]|nr:hypothetical protein [Alphaproteobacteria bacterium]
MPNYRAKRPYAFLSLTALLSAGIACIPMISSKADGASLLPLDLNSTSIAEGLPPPPPPPPPAEKLDNAAQNATSTAKGDSDLLSLELNDNSIAEGLPKPPPPAPAPAPVPAPVAEAAPAKAAPAMVEGAEKLQLNLDSASIAEGLPKPPPPAPAPAPAPAMVEGTEKLQLDLDSASIAEGLPKPPPPAPAPAPVPAPQAVAEASQPALPTVTTPPVPAAPEPVVATVAPAQPAPSPLTPVPTPAASLAPQALAAAPQPAPAPKPVVNVVPPAALAAPAAPTLANPPRPAPRPLPRNASNDVFETMRQQGSQAPYAVPVPEHRAMASKNTPPIQTLRSPNRARSEIWDNFMTDSRQQGAVAQTSPTAVVTPPPQQPAPVVAAPQPMVTMAPMATAPVAKSSLTPAAPSAPTVSSPTTMSPILSAPTPLSEEQSSYPKLSAQDSRPQPQLNAQERENLRQQLESERAELGKVVGRYGEQAAEPAPKKMPSASLNDVYQQQLAASSGTVTTLTAGVERDRVVVPKRTDNGAASANDGAAGNAATQTAMASKDTKVITSTSLPMQSASLSRVDFDGKSTVISAQAKAQLREVYRGYQQNNSVIEVIGLYQPRDEDAPRVISGGAKNSGDSDNAGLAARQAEAVSAHLLQLGVPMQSVNIIVRAAEAGQGGGAGSWVEIQRGSEK